MSNSSIHSLMLLPSTLCQGTANCPGCSFHSAMSSRSFPTRLMVSSHVKTLGVSSFSNMCLTFCSHFFCIAAAFNSALCVPHRTTRSSSTRASSPERASACLADATACCRGHDSIVRVLRIHQMAFMSCRARIVISWVCTERSNNFQVKSNQVESSHENRVRSSRTTMWVQGGIA